MVTIIQKDDLAAAAFSNNNTNAAGGVSIRVDAGSVVKGAIDAAIAALPAEKFVTSAAYAPATDTLTLTFNDASTVNIPFGQVLLDAVALVPAATDTVPGKVALAVAANYPSTSDLEAATPAYVNALMAARNCETIISEMNADVSICTDGAPGGMLFSSTVGSVGGHKQWVVGMMSGSGGGLSAPTPTVNGELCQRLASSVRVGPDAAGWLQFHSADPTQMAVGAITYGAAGAMTGAGIRWPDGGSGVYTATALSTAFPGAVDAYTVTYVGSNSSPGPWTGITRTITQPAVTRDSAGRIVDRPARIVT